MKTNKNIKLDEISKRSPFKVPENYFEDFSKKMEEHVATYAPARKVSFMMKARPYLYMAASFILILSVTLAVFNNNEEDQNLVATSNKVETVLPENVVDTIKKVSTPTSISSSSNDNEEYYEEDDEELFVEFLAMEDDI